MPSLDVLVRKALQAATEPLTAEQILERIPADQLREHANPRQKLRNALKRPDVGHATRGSYVYLPHRILGSTLRLPLTGEEGAEGRLLLGPELVYALWFRYLDWGRVPPGSAARCRLPDGTESGFSVKEMVRNLRTRWGWSPWVVAGRELAEWLREERPTAGDSLLVRIEDAEQAVCRISLERLGDRDGAGVAQRNAELADAAAHVLRNEVRGKALSPHDLAGWLLAKEFYRADPAPDPLEPALELDPRFTQTDDGHFALATRWEWARFREDDWGGELFTAVLQNLVGGPEDEGEDDEIEEPSEAVSETLRRAYTGIDPLEELRPWLEAVGYRVSGPAEELTEEEAAALDAEVAERRGQVYRLRVTLSGRPPVQRVLEVAGDDSLVGLDYFLRRTFGHEAMDHMGGFFVRTGGERRPVALATISPLGGVEDGEDMELAEMRLEPGDEMSYVYDFGDWTEHTVRVEAVLSPEAGVEYPRVVNDAATKAGKRKR